MKTRDIDSITTASGSFRALAEAIACNGLAPIQCGRSSFALFAQDIDRRTGAKDRVRQREDPTMMAIH